MNHAREDILAAIRANRPNLVPLPELDVASFHPSSWEPPERMEFFQNKIQAVGGLAIRCQSSEHLQHAFRDLPIICNSQTFYSASPYVTHQLTTKQVTEVCQGNLILDLCVVSGTLGVAENGAIWLANRSLNERRFLFLCEHLVISIFADQVVANMHDAYQQIGKMHTSRPEDHLPDYGVFISGPSKTADIEQALVIGAQGPRSLTVFLVER